MCMNNRLSLCQRIIVAGWGNNGFSSVEDKTGKCNFVFLFFSYQLREIFLFIYLFLYLSEKHFSVRFMKGHGLCLGCDGQRYFVKMTSEDGFFLERTSDSGVMLIITGR